MQCPSASSSQLPRPRLLITFVGPIPCGCPLCSSLMSIALHVQRRYALTPTKHGRASRASPGSPVDPVFERQNRNRLQLSSIIRHSHLPDPASINPSALPPPGQQPHSHFDHPARSPSQYPV